MAEAVEAEATDNARATHAYDKADWKIYENMRLMKKQMVKAGRVILCLAALLVAQGCTTPQNRVTGKSWSQTAAEEDREQRLSNSPQDYWGFLP
jgi:hypothetical protein